MATRTSILDEYSEEEKDRVLKTPHGALCAPHRTVPHSRRAGMSASVVKAQMPEYAQSSAALVRMIDPPLDRSTPWRGGAGREVTMMTSTAVGIGD